MNNKNINIAIAEDQSLFRQCFLDRLKTYDMFSIVCEATDGLDLLEQLESVDEPDVVLLDLNMPRLNGVETTKKLRQTYPDIKIIILSIYTEPHYVAAMIEHGVCGYISKSAQLSEVKCAIQQTVENGFYFAFDVLQAMHIGMMNKRPKLVSLNEADLLTQREKEILKMICMEHTTTEIAEQLYISKRTAEGHRNNLLLKTGCKNTVGLVLFALKHQLFTMSELGSFNKR